MTVTAQVQVLEVDGEEPKGGAEPTLTFKRHWNDSAGRLVVVELDGAELTLSRKDLEVAIKAVTQR